MEIEIKTSESKYGPNRCPFCGGRVASGSWTPGICVECGAEEYIETFVKEVSDE